jgi:hypothetical protein
MDELGPGPSGRMPEISDDNLAEAAPRVRALIVSRLEKMWSAVDQHIDEAQAGDRMRDPRMLEIGKGLMKAEADIYRLAKAVAVVEEEEDTALAAMDRRAIVGAKLDELEAKRRAREAGPDQAAAAS